MNRAIFHTEILPLLGEDPLPAIEWMKQRRLLASVVKSDACNEEMNWTKNSSVTDEYLRNFVSGFSMNSWGLTVSHQTF